MRMAVSNGTVIFLSNVCCSLNPLSNIYYNQEMKKFFIALVLMLGVIFVLTRTADIQAIVEVVQRGKILYLILALVMGLVYIACMATFIQTLFRIFGMEESRLHLMKVVTAASFVTVLAPSGGLSAMAVYLADAQIRGRSKVRVTVAAVLFVWFEYIGTLAILFLGLLTLAYRDNLHWSEITASLILLAGALMIGALIFLGLESSTYLSNVLVWLAKAVNRILRPFLKRDYLDVGRAHFFALEVSAGLLTLRNHPNWAIKPLLFALAAKALLWTVLFFCFMAFNVTPDPGTLVAGLSLASLFLIVSPTPAGMGIVEGVLAVALVSMGVPIEDATVVTIAYRGITFWMPFFIGIFTFRLLHRRGKKSSPQSEIEIRTVQEQ
jgi:glycosyltransferase 2 family protein